MTGIFPEAVGTQQRFLTAVLIVLAVYTCLCLIRLIAANTVADRVLAVNMLGCVIIPIIAVLTLILQEDFLVDVAIVYALISFLAVIIFSQVYIGIYKTRHEVEKLEDEADEREKRHE